MHFRVKVKSIVLSFDKLCMDSIIVLLVLPKVERYSYGFMLKGTSKGMLFHILFYYNQPKINAAISKYDMSKCQASVMK